MDHRAAVCHRVAQPVELAEVPHDHLDVGMPRRRAQIVDPRTQSGGQQAVDHVRADEPGAAGDEHRPVRAVGHHAAVVRGDA